MNRIRNLSMQILKTQKAINDYHLQKHKDFFDGEIVFLTEEPMMHEFIEEEVENNLHEDYETDMASTELAAIADKSIEIYQMIQNFDDLPAWVQSKITLAAHNITAVHDYIKYNRS